MALLSVDNLSVSFVTRNGTNKAVDNVSFTVEERQITAIIGESGSGKSSPVTPCWAWCRAHRGASMAAPRSFRGRIFSLSPRPSCAPFAGATSP
ncbi:MAG: hypothetical protein CM15mP74_05390 [Halieaceae bacterium]|nr:MAG: hypothetical protein CM15mP74_05390 [Halieaceae bacterium]